jgi:hypothetical protein
LRACVSAVLDGLRLFPTVNSSAFSLSAWITLDLSANSYRERYIVLQKSLIDFKLLARGETTSSSYAVRAHSWLRLSHTHHCALTLTSSVSSCNARCGSARRSPPW